MFLRRYIYTSAFQRLALSIKNLKKWQKAINSLGKFNFFYNLGFAIGLAAMFSRRS